MNEMIAWLRACLDDDEKVAKAAADDVGANWETTGESLYSTDDPSRQPGPFLADAYGYIGDDVGEHIVRHDPAAVLEDVAAKRAVLDATVGEVDRYGTMPPEAHIMADEVVKALASAYRHRPGWRTEWE